MPVANHYAKDCTVMTPVETSLATTLSCYSCYYLLTVLAMEENKIKKKGSPYKRLVSEIIGGLGPAKSDQLYKRQ